MSIKFAGSELPILTGGNGSGNTAGYFNAAYGRGFVYGALTVPVIATVNTEFGAGTSAGYWISFYYSTGNSTASYYDGELLTVTDTDTDTSLYVSAVNSYMTMTVYGDDGTSDSVALSFPIAVLQSAAYYVFHVEQSGADIVATAYINGVFNGSVTHAGKTSRGIKVLSISGAYPKQTNNSSYNPRISEVIIADHNLIGAHVLTIPPTGDGTHTDWGGTYEDIDELDPDAASISTSITDDISTFTHATISPLNIQTLIIAGSISSGADVDLKGVLRIGTTDYLAAFLGGTSLNEVPNFAVWEVSPATAVAFTDTEVSALEWGFKNASAA